MQHRDNDVELALDVVRDTIPAAELLDYISAEALQAWTPPGITATDLRRYCLNYFSGSYNATASRRGVLVQKVDGNEDMATHYLFVLFKRDADVPKFDAEYRSRFNELRRLVSGLWGGGDGAKLTALASTLYERHVVDHSHGELHPSLASEFLRVDEAVRPGQPNRFETALVLCKVSHIMSYGHPSLLGLPVKAGRTAHSTLPRSGLPPSRSSSLSSSPSSLRASSTTAAAAATSSDVGAMETDTEATTAASRGTAAALSFLGQISALSSNEKEEAFVAIRDKLKPDERFKLRGVLKVSALGELGAHHRPPGLAP